MVCSTGAGATAASARHDSVAASDSDRSQTMGLIVM
jgi:hypothetical protein